jgi:hypothetical protein
MLSLCERQLRVSLCNLFHRVRGAENLGLKNEPSVWRGLDVVKSKRIARRRLTGDRVQFGQQGDAFLLVEVGARNDRSGRLGLAHVVRQVRRVGGNARRQTQVADCSVALSDIIGSLADSRERSALAGVSAPGERASRPRPARLRIALFYKPGTGRRSRKLVLLHHPEPSGDFGLGFDHPAEVLAEPVLVHLVVGLDVPQTARIGADLVSEHDPHGLALP